MSLIYQEKQPTYKIFAGISLAVTLILLGIIYSNFKYNNNEIGWPILALLVVIMIFNILILFSFYELNIKVTEHEICFGFGPFKKKFDLQKIKSCEMGKYSFKNYLGFGIRFGRDRTVGYVARALPGIRLEIDGQTRKFFITSKNAEYINQLINDKLTRYKK